MAEKKKEIKKTVAKKAPVKAKANTRAKAPVKKEEVYPAINIANTFGISIFDFSMIQEAIKVTDNSLVSITQFQMCYQVVVEGR